jgi:hypothetical protein
MLLQSADDPTKFHVQSKASTETHGDARLAKTAQTCLPFPQSYILSSQKTKDGGICAHGSTHLHREIRKITNSCAHKPLRHSVMNPLMQVYMHTSCEDIYQHVHVLSAHFHAMTHTYMLTQNIHVLSHHQDIQTGTTHTHREREREDTHKNTP